MMKRFVILLMAVATVAAAWAGTSPKREFRGAWISTVHQERYLKNTTEQNKALISSMLDKLQAAGVNAVLFQARPSSDAFYDSKYEPWSRYLTKDGRAPQPYWDPLEYITSEAHKRGMELHVWVNPYRVTAAKGLKPHASHPYHKNPGRFLTYEGDGKLYFDPGQPENRKFIVDVITDIVNRYDVDGVHFDDYFYPYPADGKPFNDDASYKKYGKGMNRGDWRRKNVDMLISEVHHALRNSHRPWVRFGISPFGIWRNKASDPKGSNTNGLQNYDDLYADVLLWAQNGWIDYLIPQLYWELEHKRASSLELVKWWANAVPEKCQLYIGQDVERTMKTPGIESKKEPDQLNHKMRLTREDPRILGNCWWPAYSLIDNFQGAATRLGSSWQSKKALVPAYPQLSDKAPNAVKDIKIDGNKLVWNQGKRRGKVTDQALYVVYKLPEAKASLISNPDYIVGLTDGGSMVLSGPGVYTVTALSRTNVESQPVKFVSYKKK